MDELNLEDLELTFHFCLIVLFKLLYVDLILFIIIIGKVILSCIVDDVIIIIYDAARLVMRIINDHQSRVIYVFIY